MYYKQTPISELPNETDYYFTNRGEHWFNSREKTFEDEEGSIDASWWLKPIEGILLTEEELKDKIEDILDFFVDLVQGSKIGDTVNTEDIYGLYQQHLKDKE